jgi:hypothetical protein
VVGAVVDGLGLVVEDDGFGAGRGVTVAVARWVAVAGAVLGVALDVVGSAVTVGVERCRARADAAALCVAVPGVASTCVRVRREACAVAVAVAAAAPASVRCACLAASRCWVSWAAAAAAAPVAATADTVTRPVATVMRRTDRSRA